MIDRTKWLVRLAWERYWESRFWPYLLPGIPAALCVAVSVISFAFVRRPEPSDLISHYRSAATHAREVSKRDREDLCLRRLLILQPSDPQARYDFAQLLMQSDPANSPRVSRIMQSLASLNTSDKQISYAPAHFWLAQQIQKSDQQLSISDVETLKQHLEAALVGRDAQPAARLMLAELSFRTREWNDAVRHLKEVVEARPDLLLPLAAAYRELGTESTANLIADQAVTYYRGRANDNLEDDPSRLKWAEALVFQRQLPQALDVLKAGFSRNGESHFGTAIAQVLLLTLDRSDTKTALSPSESTPRQADGSHPSSSDFTTRIEVLEQALHYAPNHPGVLTAIAQLSTQESSDADQARDWLKDALVRGDAPATVHLILGTAAAAKGDHAMASLHLEQAHRLDPRLSVAANNLAYVLAHAEPPQPERALQLVDAALRVIPDHPEYHETRGQILLQLSRPKEAIADLELALKSLPAPHRGKAHDALARAYEALGERDLAQRHRNLAEDFKTQRASPKR